MFHWDTMKKTYTMLTSEGGWICVWRGCCRDNDSIIGRKYCKSLAFGSIVKLPNARLFVKRGRNND